MGVVLVALPLVWPRLHRAALGLFAREVTLGFEETNQASGTLPTLITLDDGATIETVATCRSQPEGPSPCTAPARLRRGPHVVRVRVMHPDGRWTPDSQPTPIEVQ